MIVAAVVLVVAAVVGIALALTAGDGEDETPTVQQVAVPTLTGIPQADAEEAITEAGLEVGDVTTEITSDESQVGNVLSSNPASGARVDEGTAVDLVVATAPDSIAVPPVVGLDEDRARTTLENAGLTGNTNTEQVDSTEPEGTVVEVDPAEGTQVAPSATITLSVSDGDAEVPDVAGQQQDAAVQALRDAGFTNVGTEEVDSADQPAGTVIGSSPSAGSQATADERITLQVSSGPAPVEVPDVVGDTEAEARAALQSAGFTNVSTTTAPAGDPGDVGVVLTVDPAEGTEVPTTQAITLTVGVEPPGGGTGPSPATPTA